MGAEWRLESPLCAETSRALIPCKHYRRCVGPAAGCAIGPRRQPPARDLLRSHPATLQWESRARSRPRLQQPAALPRRLSYAAATVRGPLKQSPFVPPSGRSRLRRRVRSERLANVNKRIAAVHPKRGGRNHRREKRKPMRPPRCFLTRTVPSSA